MLKECKIKKYEFWNKVMYSYPESNDIYECKKIVYDKYNSYILPCQILMFGATMGISYALKLHLNRAKF